MSNATQKVVTRFPPSPTGFMHIGRARTALFNFLFAKKHAGTFIFRFEDTDRERSKKEFEEDIVESLKWLGLTYDSGPTRQTEQTTEYKKYLDELLANGKAYISHEPEGKNKDVVRFKNPNVKISFQDLIRGTIEFDTTELEDFVIARNINEPLYHLAVVVDDFEMGVTHIIRGEDGISNTPRQILIQEAIGAPRPLYAHLPMILAADRSKLSGRHGAVSVREYREKGYLPEAIINYLALLGWNPGTDQEILSLDELIHMFDIEKVQKSGAVFDLKKLNWMNKEYLKKYKSEGKIDPSSILPEALRAGKEAAQISLLFETLFERVYRLTELREQFEAGELDYFYKKPVYEKEGLFWKKDPDLERTKNRLEQVKIKIESVDENIFSKDSVKDAIWEYATKEGRGEVLWPLRFALSGLEQSPDPLTLCAILGKKEVVERIDVALNKLS